MKIGVSSYSFYRLFKTGSFSFEDAISFAKETGFDAFEFTDATPFPGDTDAFAAKAAAACQKAGLPVTCYAVAADFITGSGGDMKKEVERLKGCVRTAKILGAPLLRHDSCWGYKGAPGAGRWQDAIDAIAPAIREVAEYAASEGIRTMTENHGYFIQDSERVVALVRKVNHPNYGLLVDMGNFMCADEASVTALGNVLPYAFHVHAKDFLWKPGSEAQPDDSWFPTRAGAWLRGTILGHGAVSVAQCLAHIKQSGYSGAISLEFEGVEDCREAIRRGCEFLKAHL